MSWPYSSAPERPFDPVMIIPGSKALWCENCGNVTESNNCHCVCCGSKSVLPLAKCRIALEG